MTQQPELAVISELRNERLRAVGGRAQDDVLAGLRAAQRRLPARLVYDATGFELLARLWQTPTYGGLVLGADATSDPASLLAAYEAREGCAERWAKHALAQLGGDGDAFTYQAIWQPASTRLDLSLAPCPRTALVIGGETFELDVGDAIAIDQRYQHTTEAMHAMLGIAGWQARRTFTAAPEPMRICLCDRWRHHRHR